ncbi:siderophore ABC transporter substrate-binding protein [Erwinia sp. MMLR14_017]|uniref:siderophore ABC transporter substrate-binding protein n=1 Tax=Erwinia sp. MMLR14_017 TaxID=3093842 RepID=UPI00298F89C5|nr:siderophore ABC transporter substrate-binding protein [Erwinia sp. MMLR14_017]MDW8845212.1 siderophore ABC transporter substrate-binding protein [Erwinia sp. MMLR14_017]
MKIRSALASLLVVTGLAMGSFQPALAAEKTETISVEHAQGTTQVPLNPKKVIILNPATLDNADALKIPVAGVPKNSAHLPPFLAKYQSEDYLNAGTLFEPDYEALVNARPDLIIAGGRARDAYDKLSEIAPTIALDTDPQHFVASLTQRTKQLAAIFGKQEQAKTLLADFDAKIAAIKAKSAQAGTAMVIMINGGKMSAYTPGSRFGFIYDALGFAPATSFRQTGRHGNVVSPEFILQTNPEWLFVLDRDNAIGRKEGQSAQQVLDNPLIRKTNAWQHQHIVYLDSASLYIAGGLQSYSQLMETISTALD